MSTGRLNEQAKGVFIISVTPFRDDGALDLDGVGRLVDFYAERGVHGMTILGMMGEANKLTAAEAEAFALRVLAETRDRLPVIVGVSTPSLATMRDLTTKVMDEGAAGVMVAPTPGLRTDDQVFGYFETVAEALGPDVPLVYQDYPQTTGVALSVPVWKRMVDALPSLVMLKHEDCPALAKLTRIRQGEEGGEFRRVSILVGNGALYYPEELMRGADGAMTGFAFPEMLVDVHARMSAGDVDGALDLFDAYLPLVRYEQQPGWGLPARKEVLRRRGAIASAKARYPVPALGKEGVAELDRLVGRVRRRLGEIAPDHARAVAA